MLKKLFILMFSVFMMASLCHGKEIAGVDIPESIEAGKINLILNGAGVRSKLFIKLYVGGLYLVQKSNDPENIISVDEPMAVRLHIISSMITSEKMEKTIREGFIKSTSGKIEPIKDQIENFISVFKDEIKENDIYGLIYLPDKGTDVYKNSEYHSTIEGLLFKQAMFGIWLCDKPAQASLKKDILGK
ncbi:chalcone isomerase family protein [Deltaproteobacteria bacterium]|nr:chalcone isomerase family protein [Deltaproteobacteria bacterium]